jgi:hypothetical protein
MCLIFVPFNPGLHTVELLCCGSFFERVNTLCDIGVLDAKVLTACV